MSIIRDIVVGAMAHPSKAYCILGVDGHPPVDKRNESVEFQRVSIIGFMRCDVRSIECVMEGKRDVGSYMAIYLLACLLAEFNDGMMERSRVFDKPRHTTMSKQSKIKLL
jgi:hypothetical protein